MGVVIGDQKIELQSSLEQIGGRYVVIRMRNNIGSEVSD